MIQQQKWCSSCTALIVMAIILAIVFPSAHAQVLSQTCSQSVPTDSPVVPQGSYPEDGAFSSTETIALEYQPPGRMANTGFDHLVAMMNIVTVYPCDRGRPATVELNALRIVHYDVDNRGNKIEVVDQLVTFGRGYGQPNGFGWDIYYRQPYWFTSGKLANSDEPPLVTIGSQTFMVNVAQVPGGIYHAWTNPRVAAIPGKTYFVKVVVRITGDARIQFGMDYWKGATTDYNWWSPGCTSSMNCQAYLTDWFSDTKGKFVTLVVPFGLAH